MRARRSEPGRGAAEVSIRRAAQSDVPAILEILQESPEAANWSRESLLQLASAGLTTTYVADLKGGVAGFLIGRSAGGEFEILNAAVSKAHRRHGIGSKLVACALDFARGAGIAHVYLEARASNRPAIELYARHGFAECGRRTRYYRDPVEDALLLSLRLDVTE